MTSNVSRRKLLEMRIFWELFNEKRLHRVFKFLNFADSESYYKATCICIRLYKPKPILGHLNVKFSSV
jgi:hypothetical protein